ncbi:MAG TPA: MFS transporter [Candidatus Dormibacteraeota bacterium]|nr:MFS transporter [Candidatus Dormibacteraeota bacterium]
MTPARKSTLPIYLSAGCIFMALAVRSFILPLRVDQLGGDKVVVGVLFSVGTVTGAGLSLPAGFLADRVGKRALLIGAIVVGGISQLGLGLAGSVPPLFPWQAVAGMGAAGAQAALMSALVDIVPRSRLGRAMGWLTLAFQLGFLAGPAAAGVALQWLSLQEVLTAATALFGVALVLAAVGVRAGRGTGAGWNIAGPLREIARRRAFLVAAAAMLGATVVWGTLQAYLPLFGKEHLRLPETQIGYMIAIQAVANGLARIPGGLLVDRVRRRGLLVIGGLAAYSVSLALLPHLDGFWPATALLALTVPILATVYLALGVVFGDLSTPETRGVAMGVYGTILYLGLGFGPAAFGPVIERGGYVVGFTACAVAGVALAVAAAALQSERLRPRRGEAAAA